MINEFQKLELIANNLINYCDSVEFKRFLCTINQEWGTFSIAIKFKEKEVKIETNVQRSDKT